MKISLRKIAVLLLLVTGIALTSTAQVAATFNASISSGMVISLDASAPISADYTFDITSIAFKSEATAKQFFTSMRDNLVEYKLDYAAKKVTVHLSLQFVEKRDWTITDWNSYFAKVAPRYTSNYTAINK